MAIFEKLKGILLGIPLPEDAHRASAGSKSTGELIAGLEEVFGRNRMEYDQHYAQLVVVSKAIASQRERLKTGGLTGIEEDQVMDDLEIRRGQVAQLKGRVSVLKKNMLLNQRLIGTVQDAQVMELRGVREVDIDAIIEQTEDALASYTRAIKAGEAGEQADPEDPEAEAARRIERKRKILGEEAAAVTEPAPAEPKTKTDRSQEPE